MILPARAVSMTAQKGGDDGETQSDRKRDRKSVPESEKRGNASKHFSLAPLRFDEALGGLLETDAEAVRELERKAEEKRTNKK